MLQWRGARALSEARLSRLELKLRDRGCAVRSLAAEFVHFVDVDGELSATEREVLRRLLDDGSAAASAPAGATRLWTVPRIGTISPWASKATDIAWSCGLRRVRRIERGIAWAADGPFAPGAARGRGPAPRPHDRVAARRGRTTPSRLFERAAPAPLARIPVLAGGLEALREADRRLGLALVRRRAPLPGRRLPRARPRSRPTSS